MDRGKLRMAWLLLLIPFVGCGNSDQPAGGSQANAASQEGPDAAVFKFLEAVRKGNDADASNMLTKVAQQKTKEMNLVLAPAGSTTASVAVGEVRLIGQDGAHVSSTWTDVGDDGKTPITEEFVWMVRKDPEGWRIAGMAVQVFEDQPPLLLNFEDPDDMERKQRLVEEEMVRRSQAQVARQGQPAQDPFAGAQTSGQQPAGASPGAAVNQAQKPTTNSAPQR
jgi:hypothetical protein